MYRSDHSPRDTEGHRSCRFREWGSRALLLNKHTHTPPDDPCCSFAPGGGEAGESAGGRRCPRDPTTHQSLDCVCDTAGLSAHGLWCGRSWLTCRHVQQVEKRTGLGEVEQVAPGSARGHLQPRLRVQVQLAWPLFLYFILYFFWREHSWLSVHMLLS